MGYSETETNEALIAAEAKAIEAIVQRSPQSLIRTVPIEPRQAYHYMGVSGIGDRPSGFIRFSPQDFIVEEISLDGSVSDISPTLLTPAHTSPEDKTIYADMVKIGMGTLDAIKQIADTTGANIRQIGYAGLKDGRAITSQRVSIRGISLEKIVQAKLDQVFLKIRSTGKGALAAGQLTGNRFTMFVRTQEQLDEQELWKHVNALVENGYPNFYGAQRFGNRFLNALLGKLLCQGEFDEAIKIYLTQNGPFDIPIYTTIRGKAAGEYGNWEKMIAQFDILPYRFRHERKLLHALMKYPDNPVRALVAIEDQVTFWIYGYASFILNQFLSAAYMGVHDIPNPLPIPLSGGFSDTLYAPSLTHDNTSEYARFLRQLPFWQQKYRTIIPWITPTVHSMRSIPAGVAISFSLPRAAYATTFLMFLFHLYEGTPIPPWVQQNDIDTKATLNEGNVTDTLARFTYRDRGKEIVLASETSEE